MSEDKEEADILFEERGAIGIITLNRPKALNSLTREMCVAMHAQLDVWSAKDSVQAVVIRGAGEKAFCAGGDVVSLYHSGKAFQAGDENSTGWRDFFHDEYLMNAALHHFTKPFIALLDGVTMGGGVGVSVHGSHRIATEKTMLAMPETALGLFPDVGGGYFLPRLPGEAGLFMALTGERVKAGDCCYLGICQLFVPSDRLDALVDELAAAETLSHMHVDDMLEDYADDPGVAKLAAHTAKIDALFAGDSVEDIFAALEQDGGEWALAELEKLKTKSPTSMKVTFRQVREGKRLPFDDNMRMEFRIASHTLGEGKDFYEGVRAILVEKDHNPTWQPSALGDISDADIDAYFAEIGELELKL